MEENNEHKTLMSWFKSLGFVQTNISIFNHLKHHFWMYITVLGGLVSLFTFDVIASYVGGYKNAGYLVGVVLAITAIFWFWQEDYIKKTLLHFKRNRYWYSFFTILFLIISYILFGVELHKFVMIGREYSFVFFFVIFNIIALVLFLRFMASKFYAVIYFLLVTAAIWSFMYLGGQQYIAQAFMYSDLKVVELDELPETVNVRVYPADSVSTAMRESYTGTFSLNDSDIVRFNDGNTYWVSGLVPMTKINKWNEGGISEMLAFPANKTFADIGKIEPIKLNFTVGEGLIFSRDINAIAIKRLHHLYPNVFPTNVQLMPDNNGSVVAVVSLAYHKGILFPSPEFYGVLIVNQDDFSWNQRAVTGAGTIILKEDIQKYPYLVGQNLNSEISSLYKAKSFRFQDREDSSQTNWFAPATHDNDVVVTDMPGEQNEYPIISEFNISDLNTSFYDFYELSSYKKDVRTVDKYIWIPSDGKRVIYTYTPSKHGRVFISTRFLDEKIEGTNENSNWVNRRPVEHRPYFKKNSKGTIAPYFLTSIVSIAKDRHYGNANIKSALTNLEGLDIKPIILETDPDVWYDFVVGKGKKPESIKIENNE